MIRDLIEEVAQPIDLHHELNEPSRTGRPMPASRCHGERPVNAQDFLATVCSILGIDYDK